MLTVVLSARNGGPGGNVNSNGSVGALENDSIDRGLFLTLLSQNTLQQVANSWRFGLPRGGSS